MKLLPFSWNSPFKTILKDRKQAPSCDKHVELGGIEPGVKPPISA